MKLDRPIFCAALLLGACRVPPPQGVYQCTAANVATNCPAAWVCRADGFCWIDDLPDAGPDTSASDSAVDTGPQCVAEVCNGRDDDCDDLIDEGLLSVGDAIVSTGDANFYAARLVPTSSGFALLGSGLSGFSPSDISGWVSLRADGTTTSALNTSTVWRTFLDGASFGNVVVASAVTTSGAGELVTIDLDAPGSPRSVYMLDGGPGLNGFARVANFDGAVATVYVIFEDATGGAPTGSLVRVHVDVSGAVPTVVDQQPLTMDVGALAYLATLHTHDADYVAYTNAARSLVLGVASAGPFRVAGTIVAGQIQAVALALRNPEAPITRDNPIAVAFTNVFPSLAVVTNASDLAMEPARLLSDVLSSGSDVDRMSAIGILPLPAGSDAGPGHWVLAVSGYETLGDRLRVFEITPTNIREVSVPNETLGEHTSVTIASSNGVTRIAEHANTDGLVSRVLGCR